jgi:processive 1,2-diacylglycerol beta-glucosyltransferase
VKRILVLTAGFGEGHNSAARGVRDGLARVSPHSAVEMHDLFAEVYGALNERVRRSYLALIDRWPSSWGIVYRWLDRKRDFDRDFAKFTRLKAHLARVIETFQPDAIVSTFPAYPYVVSQIAGQNPPYRNIVVVTDSITVNAIWCRAPGDFFLAPNERSAAVMRENGVDPERIKVFGFPVNPKFADFTNTRAPAGTRPRVFYVISGGTRSATETVRRLLGLEVELTVAVGRNEKLRREIEQVAENRNCSASQGSGARVSLLGWTDELPRILSESHLLIGKAGGATVQETIAAGCPMIINHIVSGQEEGNAQLIVETQSGAIARSPAEVEALVRCAFATGAVKWLEWADNIAKLSRPRASLDLAQFLLAI